MTHKKLQASIRNSLEHYLNDLQGQPPCNMYDMLLRVIEPPLLDLVMEQTGQNQSKAAQWLGINRNTLRKKLQEHGFLEAPPPAAKETRLAAQQACTTTATKTKTIFHPHPFINLTKAP